MRLTSKRKGKNIRFLVCQRNVIFFIPIIFELQKFRVLRGTAIYHTIFFCICAQRISIFTILKKQNNVQKKPPDKIGRLNVCF